MIQLQHVSKTYGTGNTALEDINISIEKGEFVFLVGHTGSGKTTLLRLLVRELTPTQGAIVIDDYDIVKLPANKIPDLRKKIGVVFQDLKLLMDRTILENITLPMEVAGMNASQAVQRAEELLSQVGILDHKEKFPVQLSGGELQRAAIARALALSPDILLADEPTGNLDEKTAFEIVDLLSNINHQGTTIIMATHNMDIVERLKKRLIALEKGKVIADKEKDKKDTHKHHEAEEKGKEHTAKSAGEKEEPKSEAVKEDQADKPVVAESQNEVKEEHEKTS